MRPWLLFALAALGCAAAPPPVRAVSAVPAEVVTAEVAPRREVLEAGYTGYPNSDGQRLYAGLEIAHAAIAPLFENFSFEREAATPELRALRCRSATPLVKPSPSAGAPIEPQGRGKGTRSDFREARAC